MGKINILSPQIFNKIAAGEVVERPASVVKELVENSIDAGATEIIISIVDGGITQIKVSDNGEGIYSDDFEKVFIPHSTSKIKTVEDLDKICSLGFRGEALASISAVAKVSVFSKNKNEDCGYTISCNGGVLSQKTEYPCNQGTTFVVDNIFYNIPARAKFLKKPRQEASEITNLITRYILANPNISFKYVVDEKEVYCSTGGGLEEAIYVVYGKDCINNLIKVDWTSDDHRVYGYIGKPTYSKPNRTYQTLIVNGRYVVNSMVSTCVYNSFEHYLMKNQFPFYVLNISIPLDKLDVNVHPNKMDIRFENSNHIYGIVYNAISDGLLNSNSIYSVEKPVLDIQKIEGGISFGNKMTQVTNLGTLEKSTENEELSIQSEIQTKNTIEQFENQEKPNIENISKEAIRPVIIETNKTETNGNNFLNSLHLKDATNIFKSPVLSQVSADLEEDEEEQQENNYVMEEVKGIVRFVGEIYSTYLIIEANDSCYIIDQHAAHERLLYDKLLREVNSKSVQSQMLLCPYTLNVNNIEHQFISDNIDEIRSLGFDIEPFGNQSFKISATPSIIKNINITEFFGDLLKDMTVFKSLKSADLVTSKLMQKACKSAIKAGQVLSENEVMTILKLMKEEQMVLECPHGRPVIIELTKKELEKWFKRTV